MAILLIIGKVFLSIFLLGVLLGGVVKLSPSHRNSDISPAIETVVGIIGLSIGLAGLYFTWWN